jgi:hypothetical protein
MQTYIDAGASGAIHELVSLAGEQFVLARPPRGGFVGLAT